MWSLNKIILLSFFQLFLAFHSHAEESVKAEHIQVSLLAPQQFGPGKTLIGIRYVMDPEWHVYWKNPGDSGSAPKFEFATDSADVGPILWPTPKRLPIGDLVNLGYDGSVILPFAVTLKPGLDKLVLEAKLEWLVCNVGECIPGQATLSLERPIGEEENWRAQELVDLRMSESQVPLSAEASPWKMTDLKSQGDTVTVVISGNGDLDSLDIFPTNGELIRPQAPVIVKTGNEIAFTFKLQASQKAPKAMDFVLTDGKQAWEWSGSQVGPIEPEPTSMDLTAFLILLFSAFLGGVILNLMPCVLPVLSIKFLAISQTPSAHRVKDALMYTAGVLVTFSFLGGIFLILRSAGASVGWGFQLQSPPVILALTILFWLMALNFLGVFEFGTSMMNAAGNSKYKGAFSTGILSVFVAAPCTGPFMGTALGAAATLPGIQSFAIFIFLGLGLASPFLLIAMSPRMRKWVPRPGAWMEKLKQFFAFPLAATVIWLLWVLHLQVGVDVLPWSLGILLLLSFVLWWQKSFRRGKFILWIVCALLILYVGIEFNKRVTDTTSSTSQESWESFSPAKVEAARAEGKAVFIDFTAAWCITCQFNKKAVLRTERTEQLFKDKGVVLFEADWTKQDPIITDALAKLGRNSVPVYVFYPAGQSEPRILPQILTPSIMEGLFQ